MQFESPSWAGELAGGSLSADEYKFATVAPWAIIVRFSVMKPNISFRVVQILVVWEEFLDEAIKGAEKKIGKR